MCVCINVYICVYKAKRMFCISAPRCEFFLKLKSKKNYTTFVLTGSVFAIHVAVEGLTVSNE